MQGSERWLSLSQRMKINAFEKNLKILLESQPDRLIALGNFVSTYMKFFGRKCKIATFGFSKLTDLIEAVPDVAKVRVESKYNYGKLPHRSPLPPPPPIFKLHPVIDPSTCIQKHKSDHTPPPPDNYRHSPPNVLI